MTTETPLWSGINLLFLLSPFAQPFCPDLPPAAVVFCVSCFGILFAGDWSCLIGLNHDWSNAHFLRTFVSCVGRAWHYWGNPLFADYLYPALQLANLTDEVNFLRSVAVFRLIPHSALGFFLDFFLALPWILLHALLWCATPCLGSSVVHSYLVRCWLNFALNDGNSQNSSEFKYSSAIMCQYLVPPDCSTQSFLSVSFKFWLRAEWVQFKFPVFCIQLFYKDELKQSTDIMSREYSYILQTAWWMIQSLKTQLQMKGILSRLVAMKIMPFFRS